MYMTVGHLQTDPRIFRYLTPSFYVSRNAPDIPPAYMRADAHQKEFSVLRCVDVLAPGLSPVGSTKRHRVRRGGPAPFAVHHARRSLGQTTCGAANPDLPVSRPFVPDEPKSVTHA